MPHVGTPVAAGGYSPDYDFTTNDRIIRRLGQDGVVDWSDHPEIGSQDLDVLADARGYAGGEIMLHLGQLYTYASLLTSELIVGWSTIIAVWWLCGNRANSIPESVQAAYDMVQKHLKAIEEGKMEIPGLDSSSPAVPIMSNRRVDRRYTEKTIRVERNTAVGPNDQHPRNWSTSREIG